MFSWTLTVGRWIGGVLAHQGTGHPACKFANLNEHGFAHTPIYTLFGLFYHIIMAGSGGGGGGVSCVKAEKMKCGAEKRKDKKKGRRGDCQLTMK